MPDQFRALDLTREHLGRYVRTREHEGYLRDLVQVDDAYVQLLLVTGGAGPPHAPVVGMGEPVEFVDGLREPVDSPPV